VHDISDDEPGPQHPLRYLVQLPIDVDAHRKLCRNAVLPKVRAILSWNQLPPADPDDLPVFGNRVDTRIQLKPRLGLPVIDAVKFGVLNPQLAGALGPATFLKFKPVKPDLMAKAQPYLAAKAENRLAFTAVKPMTLKSGADPTIADVATAPQALLSNLKIDISKFVVFLNSNKANVDYEELTCVGLDPARDSLGAIVRVKRPIGYSGTLCEDGSQEHVAFWADWNNSGAFEYLGTSSVEVHDVEHAEPIDYAVHLPTAKILAHLESCKNTNVIRIRAVLSWSSLPSKIDPWDLNTWGNRVDVLVQLRPGQGSVGIVHLLYDIGNVPVDHIDPATHLAYPGPAGEGTYRPWGRGIRIGARIYGTGAPGTVHYRLHVRKGGGAWTPLLNAVTVELMHPDPSDPLYPKQVVTVNANASGWRPYLENPIATPYPILERTARIGVWNTGTAEQGTYDIRLQYTNGDVTLPTPPPIVGEEIITIAVNNKGFTTNPNYGVALDASYDVDIVIQGGDCKLYKKGLDLSKAIDRRVRVDHQYFSKYTLDLQPSTHTKGAVPQVNGTTNSYRICNALSDRGDDGSGAGTTGRWTIASSANIDPCGYTVTLRVWDRTILDGNGAIRFFTSKAVGFAVY
jgi:hypothetical protein